MNAGKIISSAGKSVEIKQCVGLFDCLMEHKVSETTAKFNWTGPKISEEMWREVLAFFRWSQVNHKSEAQVRLFVHAEHGWLAWAFPQQGGEPKVRRAEPVLEHDAQPDSSGGA